LIIITLFIYTIILHGFHLINEIKAFTSKLTVNFILLLVIFY